MSKHKCYNEAYNQLKQYKGYIKIIKDEYYFIRV